MENLENIEKAIDKLIFVANEKLIALKQVKLAMNADALKAPGERSVSISGINQDYSSTEKDDEYRTKKNMVDKIEYLLMKEGRALKNSEILDLIGKVEGPKVLKKMRTSIYSHLSNLVKKEKAIRCMFNTDKKLAFYVKLDWIVGSGDSRVIKSENYPSPEALAGIQESRLKSENIDWSDKLKTNLNVEP